MSSCKIDHSLEDVKKKLADQSTFLPVALSERCSHVLTIDVCQNELNELFHLLKKYDLATEEEKEIRNEKLHALLDKIIL